MRRKHTYGNGGQVKCYADGGVVKKNPLPPPKKGAKPKKIEAKGEPGGPMTPGARGTYPKKGKEKG
jgi:hypothetical protein